MDAQDNGHQTGVSGSAAADRQDEYIFRAVGLVRQRWLSLMLTMVEMRPEARVLALDTDPDFGYSDLLLEKASGGGSVVSIDEMPEVTGRARKATRLCPCPRRLRFHTGSLVAGWSPEGPYDLIVSLSQFGWLPRGWLTQCAPGLDRHSARPSRRRSRPRRVTSC